MERIKEVNVNLACVRASTFGFNPLPAGNLLSVAAVTQNSGRRDLFRLNCKGYTDQIS